MFRWLEERRLARRDQERRTYYALREAQALRMQYGADVEDWRRRQLAKPNLPGRRRRFLLLVQKALVSA